MVASETPVSEGAPAPAATPGILTPGSAQPARSPDDRAASGTGGSQAALIVSQQRARRVLLTAAVLVTVLGAVGELARLFAADERHPTVRVLRVLRRYFNPSAEQTVGAWLTASVLLACGLLLFAVAAGARTAGGRYGGRWRALGAIFVFLSADEAIALHEQLGDWIAGRIRTGGPFLWAWVIPYAAFALAVAAAYLPLLRDLPRADRRRFLAAGALYVGGALVLEMVQAGITDARDRGGGPVAVLALGEEAAELVGAILFLHALLLHLAEVGPDRFVIGAGRSAAGGVIVGARPHAMWRITRPIRPRPGARSRRTRGRGRRRGGGRGGSGRP